MTKGEILKYGVEVFNGDKLKFYRWLNKPNTSLGGEIPKSLLKTKEGRGDIVSVLNRIEYGNLA